jgi:hypothetical protein
MSNANEWDSPKRQFDALMHVIHHESAGAESIDEIFDVEFRRRFAELINRTAQRNSTSVGYNWPRLAHVRFRG